MAARFRTKKYTFTGTALVALSTILGSVASDDYVSCVIVRAGGSNAGDVFWADSGSEDGGYLDAAEAASFELAGRYVSTKQIYFRGTANDVVYVTVFA